MRTFLFVLSLILASAGSAQTATDHPLTAQVIASRMDSLCTGTSSNCYHFLHLTVIIDAHHYELLDDNTDAKRKQGILMLGSYKARLVKDTHSKPYRSYREYELQYPDGETERFTVVGEATQ
jgi:hypothetical protein